MLLPDDEHVYAFTRSLPDADLGGAELLVLANFSGTGRTAGIDEGPWVDDGTGSRAEQVLGNYPPDAGALHAAGQAFDLRPWEVKVFRRNL